MSCICAIPKVRNMIPSQYVRGTFQPLVRSAVKAVKEALPRAGVTYVHVNPLDKGLFTFSEISRMWAAAFPEAVEQGRLVVTSDQAKVSGQEIKWPEDEEARARTGLSSNPPFWVKEINYTVAKAISDILTSRKTRKKRPEAAQKEQV